MTNSSNAKLPDDFLNLARIALSGRTQDVQLLIHRASKRYRQEFPVMSDALMTLLREAPSRSSPLRKQTDLPVPVDVDSRLQLLRVESETPEFVPVLSKLNEDVVRQVISERQKSDALLKHGLHPTKSMLFSGPPGVGKTLLAKWIAAELKRPLLILDLAAVMSSYLGRTGNNIRYVLDYAKSIDCILLLDELDAIAKRRDDNSEIGELKRLVTVLLQEIDDWPPSGLLIAATNHPDLLDPAVWRRFEVVIQFETPGRDQLRAQLERLLVNQDLDVALWSEILSYVFLGLSFSEAERQMNIVKKSSAIHDLSILKSLQGLVKSNPRWTKEQKVELACLLEEHQLMSQREAGELTGLSRDTIRKYRRSEVAKISEKPDRTTSTRRKGIKAKTRKKKVNGKA